MRVRVLPGPAVNGETRVPGDKSIAHRWIMLAATADGPSHLHGLPAGLDVCSTCQVMGTLSGDLGLLAFAEQQLVTQAVVEGDGRTWNKLHLRNYSHEVQVKGKRRDGLLASRDGLDCGNSGTTMRLTAGIVAASPFRTVLRGDSALTSRPMERVAEPLRQMGAEVRTTGGHAPLEIVGGRLRGIHFEPALPSAQVKSAVLLAGLAADGETTVVEPISTRDHTERALEALGAPIRREGRGVSVTRFQQEGFDGKVPGDPSSAAFLLAAAIITGGAATVRGVALNPSRTAFLEVFRRMGAQAEQKRTWASLGEPAGTLAARPPTGLRGVTVDAGEVAAVIDEVPVLAAVAAHADGETRFRAAGELRVKEANRLEGLAAQLRELGGGAEVQGDDLVVAGGGLRGGQADALGDHRLAMALTVAALGAGGPSEISGMEWANVSFPGFLQCLAALGAQVEPA